jgi:ubiquinone/menaquinone biosynthesis C-methylase UbiE
MLRSPSACCRSPTRATEIESAALSISFDRAADFYDRTRALPPEIQAKVTALLVAELDGRGAVLELGVGTGRMALPLHALDVELTGIDLSVPILQRLVVNAGGRAPFPLAVADGERLPFPDGSFDAAFLCHVLHLVPAWRLVVGELAWVVRPGGLLLVDLGGPGTPEGEAVRAEFARRAGQARPRPGVTDPAVLDAELEARGATLRVLEPITHPVQFTVGRLVDRLASNQFSATWSLPEGVRMGAAAATRAWAVKRFGDLDAVKRGHAAVVWRAYDLPGSPRLPER